MLDGLPAILQTSEETPQRISQAALFRLRAFYSRGHAAPDRCSRSEPSRSRNRLSHKMESHTCGPNSRHPGVERRGSDGNFQRHFGEFAQSQCLRHLARPSRPLEGDDMTKHEEAKRLQRRSFLKAAGGAAMGLVAAKDALGQSARPKPATHTDRLPKAPADRGLWITW